MFSNISFCELANPTASNKPVDTCTQSRTYFSIMSSLTLVGKAFPCRLNEFISYSINFETWGLKFAPNFQIWKRNS